MFAFCPAAKSCSLSPYFACSHPVSVSQCPFSLNPQQSFPPLLQNPLAEKSICSLDVALINACPAHKARRPSLKWHSCTYCPLTTSHCPTTTLHTSYAALPFPSPHVVLVFSAADHYTTGGCGGGCGVATPPIKMARLHSPALSLPLTVLPLPCRLLMQHYPSLPPMLS